jgi:hypothetical protein
VVTKSKYVQTSHTLSIQHKGTFFENLLHDATRLILKPMQLSDFFNAGGGLADTVKIVFFKMLPRGAQIEKVRAEINRGLLKKYGKLTKLEIDKDKKAINANLDLKGEKEGVRISLSNYRLILDEDKNPLFAGRPAFALATQADDADIRRLLRENPMPGQITLTLEREPDYFADADVLGTEKQTIIAKEGGRVACVGNCAIRERFVNGQPRRVGYLGGLRLDARATGRFDILRRGYEFFRELQADRPADFYFTSIATDNVPARKFLERGLPGMPSYEFIGDFLTLLLPTRFRASNHGGTKAGKLDFAELAGFLNEHGREYQFTPYWSGSELAALQSLNLNVDDFESIREGGRFIAAAALWDQRPFKQTVIRGYEPWLAMARPALNFGAGIIGKTRLPAVGSTLSHAFLSQLALATDRTETLGEIVLKLCSVAKERGIEFLAAGFAANDPRLSLMRGKFRFREYASRIYIVRWPGMGGSARELASRCLSPEVALL